MTLYEEIIYTYNNIIIISSGYKTEHLLLCKHFFWTQK